MSPALNVFSSLMDSRLRGNDKLFFSRCHSRTLLAGIHFLLFYPLTTFFYRHSFFSSLKSLRLPSTLLGFFCSSPVDPNVLKNYKKTGEKFACFHLISNYSPIQLTFAKIDPSPCLPQPVHIDAVYPHPFPIPHRGRRPLWLSIPTAR